jgi:hypothetical protein
MGYWYRSWCAEDADHLLMLDYRYSRETEQSKRERKRARWQSETRSE